MPDDYLLRYYSGQSTKWLQIALEYLKRAVRVISARRYDLLWIEKELFPNLPGWFEQALTALRFPYVVDYDDAIFHRYDLSSRWTQRLLARKIDAVMRGAALVICGNQYLAERAESAGARRIEIIPTVVDLRTYRPHQTSPGEKIVIGWIGTPHTVRYLKTLAPALQSLALRYPVVLRVVGADIELDGVAVECRRWSEQSEVRDVQSFDIGIMPLFDSPWERGKCGYKLIQYMACGVPVVASPVGVNVDIVTKANGYLATSTDDWIISLSALCADARVRSRMGEAGRRLVEDRYSLQVMAPRLANLLRRVIEERPGSPRIQ